MRALSITTAITAKTNQGKDTHAHIGTHTKQGIHVKNFSLPLPFFLSGKSIPSQLRSARRNCHSHDKSQDKGNKDALDRWNVTHEQQKQKKPKETNKSNAMQLRSHPKAHFLYSLPANTQRRQAMSL